MARVIVVGGGAAGLMAACAAADAGHSVTLLERNEKLGKKLYITGKGRCNFTNTAEDFLAGVPRNARFLYSAYNAFDNRSAMRFFEEAGVPYIVERGGRVFPASGKASDITRALERRLRQKGVRVLLNTRVRELCLHNDGITGVKTDAGGMPADAAVVATGGASYPSTGSTGDGYAFARSCEHNVFEPRPALSAMETHEDWVRRLAGLTLKNVVLSASQRGRKFFEEQGELLFTHSGISGPLVLSASCYSDGDAEISVAIDLKPALSAEQLDMRILREFEAQPRRQYNTALGALLPNSLVPVIAAESGIPAQVPVHQITRAQRRALCCLLKSLELRVRAFCPLEEAIITRGGVDTRQINPSTMESKLVRSLYFAGELIDTDGLTGGFNLQIAFSTGHLAGSSIR